MSGLPIDIVDTGAGSFYGLAGGSSPLSRPNWVAGASQNSAASSVPTGYFFNPYVFRRPVVSAGQLIPSSGGTARADAAGTDIGNVGRNVLRGPRQANVDISLIKRFHFHDSRRLEFRVEVLNLLNHVNLANPISDFNAVLSSGIDQINQNTGVINSGKAGAFGRIVSTSGNSRIIQFAFKLTY